MKLSLAVLAILPAAAFGAVSQPECKDWTQMHLYDTNPELQPAEDAYVEMVAGSIEANCLDENGPKECSFGLGQSDAGDKYTEECTKNGGKMWTYTMHPLCGEISSTSQTEITGILVCASASCEDIGVSNLIPNQGFNQPFVDAGYNCGTGTSNLKAVETEFIKSQPECQPWTQMHNFDTNADMKPTEDAYFEQVAETLEAKCMQDDVFTGCGDFQLDEEDESYISQCHKTGGHIWTYKFSPLCYNSTSPDEAGMVSGMLVCASASCVDLGTQSLIPPTEAIFAPFTEAGIPCGSATNDLEKFSVPNTQVDDTNPGQTPSGASFLLTTWMPLVSALAAVVAF